MNKNHEKVVLFVNEFKTEFTSTQENYEPKYAGCSFVQRSFYT